LRIAIDALALPAFGGAKSSALGWLTALARYDRNNHYLVFLSRPEDALVPFANVEQRLVPVHNRLAVRLWAQVQLPRLLAREQIDVLHSMKNLSVFAAPCPTIITINDLSHVILRHLYPWIDGLYWQVLQPQILHRARRVIAISENTKHDLQRFYGLQAHTVVTIYPSCDDRFRQTHPPEELERMRSRYGLPQSMLLYVGGLGVHKNVITLLRAFARVADQIPHGLVLVGGAHHTSSDLTLSREVEALGLAGRVWMLGSIPLEDLPPLYQLADLFLLASLNEGFGLVLLEAMACGVPVLAARKGSVPEVVGECAQLVDDPLDVDGFSSGIVTLLADRRRLGQMRTCGLQRSQLFTWDRTVEHTLALYQEVASGKP